MKYIKPYSEFVSESVYCTDEYGEEYYNPSKDGRYKALLRKPINKLSKDDMLYLYAIHFTRTSSGWYISCDFDDLLKKYGNGRTDWGLDDAHAFFSNIRFPLKIYRALRKGEMIDDICGKTQSLSWTTDPKIYFEDTSLFKHCDTIVEAEIDSDVIQNEWTVVNYVLYSSSRYMERKNYPESEISLKPRFKRESLKNLKYLDKSELKRNIGLI